MQIAIIKKDIRGVTTNKQLMLALILVPLIVTVVLPAIFVTAMSVAPDMDDFQVMLDMLPVSGHQETVNRTLMSLVLNNIMPIFFILIPIMSASVMAASSFVGEKEKRTLETLLYCPLSLKQIFHSKVLASFFLSMAVSIVSFIAMLIVVETIITLTTGSILLPDISWLVIILLISPAVSLLAVTLIVGGSAKAQTVEESQQRTVFLIMPLILLIAGQFTGVVFINAFILLGIGVVLAALAVAFMNKSRRKFTYELLLK